MVSSTPWIVQVSEWDLQFVDDHRVSKIHGNFKMNGIEKKNTKNSWSKGLLSYSYNPVNCPDDNFMQSVKDTGLTKTVKTASTASTVSTASTSSTSMLS